VKEAQSKTIDIREVIHSKNPRLAKLLPGFAMGYIKKIIHENEVNEILEKHGNKSGLDFVEANIKEFNITLLVKGEENIPRQGRYIFAANHPLGGFDGLLLLYTLSKHYQKTHFFVNDILMNIKQLRPLFIPINKHGAHSRENAELIERTYAADGQVLTFPAGLVSRKIKGEIIDLEWKKSFIAKAVKYQRDIVPVHITGGNSRFFYNFAKLRKALGIKKNIEMFYLVDETFKHRNKTITLTFGQPVSWRAFNNTNTYNGWAQFVKDKVYALPET